MMIAKCVKCQKKFSKASNLYRHQREQHGIKKNIEKEINELYCVTCNKYFKRKEHYDVHMNAIHLFKHNNVCSLCDYSTFTKSAMRRHESRVHVNSFSGFNMRLYDKCFSCYLCTKRFSVKRALDFHQQKKHGLSTSNTRVKRICPLCSHSVVHSSPGKANKMMYDHFYQKHELLLDIDFLESEDLIAFYNWKANLEKRTSSKFNRSNRRATKSFRFSCYRSGMSSSKRSDKRVLRSIKSCKINAFCPAAIIAVLKDDGKVQVTFIKTHVGHNNDNWLKTSRKKIQLKMKAMRNRHKASLSLGSDNVFARSDGEWQIPSPKGNCYFNVRKIQTSICENCDLKCCHCNACIHQYTCSCADYTSKGNMCKHIHFVAKSIGYKEAVFVNEDDLLVINESCNENLVVVDIHQEEDEVGINEEVEADELEFAGEEAEGAEEEDLETEEEREDEEEDDGEEELEMFNDYPLSKGEIENEMQEREVDSTAQYLIRSNNVEVTKQTYPSNPPPSSYQQAFLEAKKKFAGHLLATVRDKITNFQELEAVQKHWKSIESILNTPKSNSSDLNNKVLQKNIEHLPPKETLPKYSNSSMNNFGGKSSSEKKIICFKVISSSKSD